ncbi:hypothetical protein [Candidatus Magnetomonas plexicatena]|uniref:hypothetical protein n=1 Tax=Candidatus Magnetomonas plexicatena TaxID=2552947 RepID=UPI001C778AF9|nr:hypothetical protein E2O03_008475 [Nitrospirales bacterium LBB_01]
MERFGIKLNNGLLALALVSFVFMAYPVLSLAEKTVDPEKLFESKCSQCHPSDRPKSVRKTPAEWKETVDRMQYGNGCDITDEEAAIVVKYLSSKYHK